jgi:hypothetical protein
MTHKEKRKKARIYAFLKTFTVLKEWLSSPGSRNIKIG